MKQQQEYPEYLQDHEKLIQLFQSGMIRCNNYYLNFGDIFIKEAKDIISQVDQLLPNVQESIIQYQNIQQLSEFLLSLRSAKSLPFILKEQEKIHQTQSQTIERPYTAYDQDYFILSQNLDIKQILQQINEKLNLQAQIIQNYHGYLLVQQKEQIQQQIQEEIKQVEEELLPLEMVNTPGAHTIDDLAKFFNVGKEKTFKLVCYEYQNKLIFCFIRGDKNVSLQKLQFFLGINPYSDILQMAQPELLEQHGIVAGYGGIINIKQPQNITIIFDNSCKNQRNVIIGANKTDYHWKNYNYERDSKNIMKQVIWTDLADDGQEYNEKIYDIFAEYYNYQQFSIKLSGENGQQQLYPLQQLRIRLTDIIKQRRRTNNITYVCINIPPKFKEDYQKCIDIANKQEGYVIIDDRPKITAGVKIDTVKSSKINKLIILNGKMIKENQMQQITFNEKDQEVSQKELNFSQIYYWRLQKQDKVLNTYLFEQTTLRMYINKILELQNQKQLNYNIELITMNTYLMINIFLEDQLIYREIFNIKNSTQLRLHYLGILIGLHYCVIYHQNNAIRIRFLIDQPQQLKFSVSQKQFIPYSYEFQQFDLIPKYFTQINENRQRLLQQILLNASQPYNQQIVSEYYDITNFEFQETLFELSQESSIFELLQSEIKNVFNYKNSNQGCIIKTICNFDSSKQEIDYQKQMKQYIINNIIQQYQKQPQKQKQQKEVQKEEEKIYDILIEKPLSKSKYDQIKQLISEQSTSFKDLTSKY